MIRPNTSIIKFISLLSIVRWYNILIVSIALLLAAVFLLNPPASYWVTLSDIRLYTCIISVAFLMKAGFIINAFYDFEKDIINRPSETIFGRIVSKATCLNAYVLFILIGLLFALLTDWKVFLFNFFFSFALWVYSHKLRKKIYLAELSAALLTVAPFFSLSIYNGNYNLITFVFVGYIFVLTFTREIIKKMTSIKGDLVVGEKSLPIVLGIRKTKYILLSFMLLAMLSIISLFNEIKYLPIVYYFLGALVTILIAILLLRGSKTSTQFNRLNVVYKLLLISGIMSIPLATHWPFW
jgi:4-hydroxybenzoate polyprenyltransferase